MFPPDFCDFGCLVEPGWQLLWSTCSQLGSWKPQGETPKLGMSKMSKSLDWWLFKPCCFVVVLKTQTHLYRTVYCVYCVTWECTGSYTVYITHVSSSCACCSWANDLSFKSLSKSEVDMMCSDEIKAFLEGMSIAHYLEPRTDFPKESSMEKDKRPVLQTWVDKIMFLETESDLKSVRRGETSLFDRWKIWKCPMLPT